jgi:hypothetical protein
LRQGDDRLFRQTIGRAPDIHRERGFRPGGLSQKEQRRETDEEKLDAPVQSWQKNNH